MPRMEFQHHPLVKWPREETPAHERRGEVFRSRLPATLQLLAGELSHLRAINPVLITTAHAGGKDIRIDGVPRDDVRLPSGASPGVVVEFFAVPRGKDGPRERMQFACDRYRKWTHNLHAIALTLESLRAVDRYGATAAGEQYAGFKSLPAPGAAVMTVEAAAEFLRTLDGVGATPRMIIESKQVFVDAYRAAVRKTHPDAGGKPEAWHQLQQADAVLRAHHHL